MIKHFLVFFLVLVSVFGFSQEKIGLITDGRLPVNQARINPALMVDQSPWLSINLLGGHAFTRTNFIKLQDTRLWFGQNQGDFVYEEPSKNGKGYIHAEILGPSATINIEKHAIGFHTSFRLYGNVNRMPAVLGQIIGDNGVENVNDGTYSARNARAKEMSWVEFGLSYGTIVYQRNTQMLNIGATVNRIIGIQQANFIINSSEVDVVDGDGTLRDLDGKYSYAEPAWGAGKGWSFNLGANYKRSILKDVLDDYIPHSRKGSCKRKTYRYTVGVSLLDLGYVRYKTESRTGVLPDTTTIDNLEDAVAQALGLEESSFTAILPTALAIQADYRIQENVFIGANLIQKISFPNSFGVERANVLAVAPRIETSWLTVSLPMSMANYTTPQLGLYVRIGPLAIGTDHLSPYIVKRDIRAADVYVYFNIPLSKSPGCRDKSARDVGKWMCPVW